MNTETLTAKDIFIELVSHVPPEQWNERLAQACQGNDDLGSRVRALGGVRSSRRLRPVRGRGQRPGSKSPRHYVD